MAPIAPYLIPWAAGLRAPPFLPLALALLASLLLYALLRDFRALERPPPWRAALFALLGGLVAWALASREGPQASATSVPPRAFEAHTQAMIEAKGALALEAAGSGRNATQARARAVGRYRAAVAAAPNAPRFRRELGIFLGATGDRPSALRELRRTAAALARMGLTARAREEAALWPAIYGETPPRRTLLPALRARVTALRLGWFRHLALETLYRRAGVTETADAERRAARQAALTQQLGMGLLVVALFGAGIVGLGIGILFVRQAARRAWRPVEEPFAGPAFPLWEAFLLYLAIHAAPAILPGRLFSAVAGDAVGGIVRILATDLLAIAPLLYLALAYRRRGLSLTAIGLRGWGAVGEVGRGVAGYAAMIPWVIAAAMASQWAGQRFFPGVEPPFHPVQALTLAAPSPWARVALFLIVAVFAPLWEEIFFRGMLQGALRRRFGAVSAAVASSALFAALHPQLPLGFVPIFLIGLFLAAFYEWRRSLVPGIVLHAINNGVIFLLLSLLFPPSG